MIFNNLDWKQTSDVSSATSHKQVGFKVRGDSPERFPAEFWVSPRMVILLFHFQLAPFPPADAWFPDFQGRSLSMPCLTQPTETLGTQVWTNLGLRTGTLHTPECYWASLAFSSPEVSKHSTNMGTVNTDGFLTSHGSPWKASPFPSLFPLQESKEKKTKFIYRKLPITSEVPFSIFDSQVAVPISRQYFPIKDL